MTRLPTLLAALLAALPLAAAACNTHAPGGGKAAKASPAAARKAQTDWGTAGSAKAVQRTIEITVSDELKFSPAAIEVREGETVKLVVRHTGQAAVHDVAVGSVRALEEHADAMMAKPGMKHAERWITRVKPGQPGTLVWKFNRAGEFQLACVAAGHYQAGMTGPLRVAKADPTL